MNAPTSSALKYRQIRSIRPLTGPQLEVLVAMISHKLIWRAKDDKCLLLSGNAPAEGVRRITVQRLLDTHMIEGPIEGPLPKLPKDAIGRYDAIYKMTPAGRKMALAAA